MKLGLYVMGLTATVFSLAVSAAPAPATAPLTYCVYDPIGAQGQSYGMARDYALVARTWGVNLNLRAYTDERVAADDFKAGQCDAVAITGLRARQFNSFVGSIDSIGAVPSYQHLRNVITTLSNPRLADRMVNAGVEVVGIIPLGAAYVHVRDRSINSIEKAAGRRIAVFDYDKSQARMVQQLGAQPVAADITNFGTKFNNGQVDIIAAPAIAFKPLELHRGLGTTGAIYRFPLIQLTANVLIRKDRFPADFGVKSRAYVQSQLDVANRMVDAAEREIPSRYWLELNAADRSKYFQMMKEARMQMTRDGFYDPRMMNLLKRVRCQIAPTDAECADSTET